MSLYLINGESEILNEERKCHPSIEMKFWLFSFQPEEYNVKRNDEVGNWTALCYPEEIDNIWKRAQIFSIENKLRVTVSTKKQIEEKGKSIHLLCFFVMVQERM